MSGHSLKERTYKDGSYLAECECGRWSFTIPAPNATGALSAHQLHTENAQRAETEEP